jgi:aryl-alcohol dehydrogenase-like predicted oxidoreductase
MRLIIGTAGWRMPYGTFQKNLLTQDEIQEILNEASQRSVLSLDTSPDYGDAELIIGQCNWKGEIATKFVFHDESEIDLELRLRQSLDRLQVESLDLVFIHNWDALSESQKTRAFNFLSHMKHNDLVKCIGVSTYSLSEVKSILSSKIQNIYIQINMNVLDQRVAELKSEEWQIKLLENEIKLWGRSIFLQGILLDFSTNNPFLRHPDMEKFRAYSLSNDSTPYELCVAFPRQLGFIDAIVVGINSKVELLQLIESVAKPLKKSEIAYLSSSDSAFIDPRSWK